MKIAIVGTGNVGLSMAVLLSQRHEAVALDVVPAKVDMINRRQSPILAIGPHDYLANKPLYLRATLSKHGAYTGAGFIIIATPTDFDPVANHLNTRLGGGGNCLRVGHQPPDVHSHEVHSTRGLYRPAQGPSSRVAKQQDYPLP